MYKDGELLSPSNTKASDHIAYTEVPAASATAQQHQVPRLHAPTSLSSKASAGADPSCHTHQHGASFLQPAEQLKDALFELSHILHSLILQLHFWMTQSAEKHKNQKRCSVLFC